MGSFSYSCALTGLPICSGDEVLLLPLKMRNKFYENSEETLRKAGKANFCSNEGERVFFTEGTYPIFGKYDDYGGIEDIIVDDNTKAIEEYFGVTITEFCNYVCDGRTDGWEKDEFSACYGIDKKTDKYKEIVTLSATWFRKDVYDLLLSKYKNDSFNCLGLGNEEILLELGFEFVKDENKDEVKKETDNRYHLVYQKDKLKIKSDGEWLQLSENKNIYNLKDFKLYCEKKGVAINIEKIWFYSVYEQLYELTLPKIRKSLFKELEFNKRLELIKQKKEYTDDSMEDLRLQLQPFEFVTYDLKNRRINELFCSPDNYGTKDFFEFCKEKVFINLESKFLKTNIVNWLKFRPNMFFLGRFLSPTSTTAQCGEHAEVKKIFETALEVINKDIEEKK